MCSLAGSTEEVAAAVDTVAGSFCGVVTSANVIDESWSVETLGCTKTQGSAVVGGNADDFGESIVEALDFFRGINESFARKRT
jgi:hypothetical protein